MSLLRLSDGTKLCEKTYDERIFSSLIQPVFDPSSGGVYLFDTEAQGRLQGRPATCQQAWVYLGTTTCRLRRLQLDVVGAGGTRSFALNP